MLGNMEESQQGLLRQKPDSESGGNYFTYLFVHDFLGRTVHTGVSREDPGGREGDPGVRS